jgi:CMP-N-acetylneuraminic acid synthetase
MSDAGATVALIPARGGSKGVPGKNIRLLAGHPLIAYAIAAARLCPAIDRVVVSTDSEEIARVAERYGAEVPFLRPAALAQDSSPDIDFFRHALEWFETHGGGRPKSFVQLRPTTPLRDPALIAAAVHAAAARPEATALRSVHELPEPPQKMMGIRDGFLVGLFPDDPRPEYYNLPRQTFPPAYHPNGYVDIVLPSVIAARASLHGSRILGFITPAAIEIDQLDTFEYLEYVMAKQGHPLAAYLNAQAAPGASVEGTGPRR